jgi:putative protease
MVATGTFSVGDSLLITGPTTGVIEYEVPEIRVDMRNVGSAVKGDLCSIPVAEKLRRGDKIYLFQ